LEETAALGLTHPRVAVPQHRGEALVLERPFDAPDPADLAAVRRWVTAARRPNAVDLFCGAGGLALGLQDAGFSVLVGADNDRASVETHVSNLRGLGYYGDLSDPADLLAHLSAWGVDTVDLLAGGVPCQPFSRAGQSKLRSLVSQGARSVDDPRTHLWSSFLVVVEAVRPRAVLVENVPDLASWDDGGVLINLREGLRDLGYWTDARLLEAHRYGVPQHRARLFVVALHHEHRFSWPEPSPASTLRDAIGDLPSLPGGQHDEVVEYVGEPRSQLQQRLRRGVPRDQRRLVFDHITRAVRPDDAEAFALMRPGHTYLDLPEHLRRYRSDIFHDKYKRLEWDELSRTITAHIAKDGYSYIHPSQDRTLSIREAARLQTFPDWYRFSGHPTSRYRQIGNAVPPLLAESLGRSLRALSAAPSHSRRAVADRFRDRLIRWHSGAARPYPWRNGAPAWHVLMAEMCLHRTRADQVAPVYVRLVELAPTPADLVRRSAEARAVLRPLGLRWRTDNILAVAAELVRNCGGVVPETKAELQRLPGVGDYVSNAVLCFARSRRAVLLDTNTERIVSRIRGAESVRRTQMRMDLYDLAGRPGPDRAFNYALLDLGGLVCRASKPTCATCPVRTLCATGSRADPSELGLLPKAETW
jgi:DNA (cytosine-5)-methyltransferase 1